MLTPEQYISWLDSGLIEAYKQARDSAVRIKMEEK